MDLLSYVLAAVELPPGSFRTDTIVQQAQSYDWFYKMLSVVATAAGVATTAYVGSPAIVAALALARELWSRPTRNSETAPVAGEPRLALPKVEHDYSACFVTASEGSGLNRANSWQDTQRAIEAPESWVIDLQPKDRELIRKAIVNWVNVSFASFHAGSEMDNNNNNHRVFVAYLYWRAVDRLAAGEFGRHFSCEEVAEAIRLAAATLTTTGATHGKRPSDL